MFALKLLAHQWSEQLPHLIKSNTRRVLNESIELIMSLQIENLGEKNGFLGDCQDGDFSDIL